MAHCEDCGTRLELNGTCPNCHEELWIATWQPDDMQEMSQEFYDLVQAQAAEVKRKHVAPEGKEA